MSDSSDNSGLSCLATIAGALTAAWVGTWLVTYYGVVDPVSTWLIIGASVLVQTTPATIALLFALAFLLIAGGLLLAPFGYVHDWYNRPTYTDEDL